MSPRKAGATVCALALLIGGYGAQALPAPAEENPRLLAHDWRPVRLPASAERWSADFLACASVTHEQPAEFFMAVVACLKGRGYEPVPPTK